MRTTYLNFFLVTFIAILLYSCNDMIDSDPNLSKTKVYYDKVLDDQEHNVIMPLRVGNLWVYKVSSYDKDGLTESISFDTVKVVKDTIINNEKWFKIQHSITFAVLPVIGFEYLTNTNKGLFSRSLDPKYVNTPDLLAQYPIKDDHYFEIIDPCFSEPNGSDGKDDLEIWTNTLGNNIFKMIYGTYTTNRYTRIRENARTHEILEYPKSEDIFVPNLGLIVREILYSDGTGRYSQAPNRRFELIYTNVQRSQYFTQNIFEIDFGSVPVGNQATRQFDNIFFNDGNGDLLINNFIITWPDAENFTLNNPMMFPIVVGQNQAFGLEMSFNPTRTGEFRSRAVISTNEGEREILLLGRGV